MAKFVETPLDNSDFNPQGAIPKGGSQNTYDGCKEGPFGGYPRTSSPNAQPEVAYDGTIGKPSGESDQF